MDIYNVHGRKKMSLEAGSDKARLDQFTPGRPNGVLLNS
jgi:hypothetical protein